MATCRHFQAQMLDRLYDLLDAADARALDLHLSACPACKTAMGEAERVQRLLAAAAKTEFPNVRFQAPAAGADVARAATTAAAPLRRSFWRQASLAVAACLLLALGIPAVGHLATARRQQDALTLAESRVAERQQSLSDLAAAHSERLTKAQSESNAARQEYQNEYNAVTRKLGEAEQTLREKELYLVISGPGTLQPGATNEYRVDTYNFQNRPAPANLAFRVKDQAEKVVYETTGNSTGTWALKLPPDLPLTPRRELFLEVTAESAAGKAQLQEKVQLAVPQFMTHLTTDKPMYQPGETVYFRSLTLDRFTLRPPTDDFALQFVVRDSKQAETVIATGTSRVAGADAQPIIGPDGQPVRGVGAGAYQIPSTAMGGEYTLAVRDLNGVFPEERRKFIVNEYRPHRLQKELEWSRSSYGPGDDVVANCKVKDAGGPVVGKPVTAEANVDGTKIPATPSGPTDARGTVAVRFTLPKQIDRGLASLTVNVDDGGPPEGLTKPIPIALKKLFVDFFPEGGELVAGVPNRVYFQARTTLDKPAEVRGRIVDGTGKAVADAATLSDDKEPGINQGQGRVAFTPEFGQTYRLAIDTPAGTEGEYKLPAVKPDGVVLTALDDATADPAPMRVRVTSAGVKRDLLVGCYARGRLLDHSRVSLDANKSADVELKPEAGVGGVTRVTVFEEHANGGAHRQLTPVAERLVYRRPSQTLKLAYKTDKDRYAPGDRVGLRLTATNEKGEPEPALVMLGVVNQSVVTMADEKTARSMPTHFLLTSEVRKPEELEHADVLLGNHPKAAQALDLLLGTQGWRRFVEQSKDQQPKSREVEAERVVVVQGQNDLGRRNLNSFQIEQEKVLAAARPALALSQKRLSEADAEVAQVRDNPEYTAEAQQRGTALAQASGEAATARAALDETLATRRRAIQMIAPILLTASVAGMALALVWLLVGARRGIRYPAAAAWTVGLGTVAAALAFVVTLQQPGPNFTSVAQLYTRRTPTEQPLAAAADGNGLPPAAPALEALDAAKLDALGERLRRDGAAKDMPAGGVNVQNGAFAGVLQNAPVPQPPGAAPVPTAPPATAAVPAPAGKPMNQEQLQKRLAEQEKKALDDRLNFEVDGKPGEPAGERRLDRDKDDKEFGARLAIPRDEAEARHKGKAVAEDAPADRKQQLRGGVAEADANRGTEFFRRRAALGTPANQPAVGGGGMPLPPAQPAQGIGGGIGGMQGGGAGIPGGGPSGPAAGFGGFGGNAAMPGGGGGRIAGGRGLAGGFGQNPTPIFNNLLSPFVVREYAHTHKPTAGGVRKDFAETVFWHPVLVLSRGETAVNFDLSEDVTRFRVLAAAHSPDGRLGAVEGQLESRQPFSLAAKLPVEVTSSDTIDIPIGLVNDTDVARPVTVVAEATNLAFLGDNLQANVSLGRWARDRRVFRFKPTVPEGEATFNVTGKGNDGTADKTELRLPIVPEGFPIVNSVSDVLERVARHEVTLPQTWIPGTLKCQVSVFPSTLADLQTGLEALLREPGGCFEQTSTSNYPNTLILEYLKESDQANPAAVRRAKEMLARGYVKLTSFEVPEGGKREGFEWFGQAPAHEALTAYGLMQFRDMARVHDVDPTLLKRTRDYLLSRRDGQGGFTRNPRALDTFGRAPQDVTNAYIIWAVTESGKEEDVTRELNKLAEQAQTAKDPYFLALVANALLNRDRTEEAAHILKTLAAALTKDGYLDGAKTSITGSGGRTLQIETTALAVLGWLKANRPADFANAVRSAVQWIGKQRGGYGGFGSTQSTIMALKALIAYTKANRQAAEGGELSLYVGDQLIEKRPFAAGTQDALTVTVPDADRLMKPGKNDVRVEVTGRNTYGYTLTWSYQSLQPASAEGCAVKLTTSLDRSTITEGESVRLNAKLENVSGKGQGMAVAVIGLPAGLKLPEDLKQLKDLARLRDNGTKPGVIGAFELRGRELVLYWRDVAPDAKINVALDLQADVPGEYRGPASRAYLYYNADVKYWTTPLAAAIKVKP
jgi:hypothetical protein